jgi:hypothetical protein
MCPQCSDREVAMGAHRAQHRARGVTSPAADLAADHPGWVIATAVAVIAAVAALGVFFASTGGSPTPVASTTVTASTNRLDTPQAHAYFAALYTDGGIGPKDLTADNALKLGEHVCDMLREGDSLATSYAYVRDVTRLDKMQAARAVDAADRNLCHK